MDLYGRIWTYMHDCFNMCTDPYSATKPGWWSYDYSKLLGWRTHTQIDRQTDTHTDKLQWKYSTSTVSWRCNYWFMVQMKCFISLRIWTYMDVYGHDCFNMCTGPCSVTKPGWWSHDYSKLLGSRSRGPMGDRDHGKLGSSLPAPFLYALARQMLTT